MNEIKKKYSEFLSNYKARAGAGRCAVGRHGYY